jgi:hypothetical protein
MSKPAVRCCGFLGNRNSAANSANPSGRTIGLYDGATGSFGVSVAGTCAGL